VPLPTNRTLLDTPEEHLDDHNALCAQHNELEGHADDTTNVHGIANTAVLATQSYVTTAVANLVDAAPGTLDTLNELAAALGDDANFATTVTNALAGKAATGHNHDASYEAAGAVAAHTGDTSDAHDASAVSFAPAGGIAATDVQAAIVELDSEKSGTGHAHTGTYVPLAEIDAKGDLLVGSAADTLNNLGVGTDGHVLTADSAETLGVKWAAASGGSQVATGRAASGGTPQLSLPGVDFISVGTKSLASGRLYYIPMLTTTAITLDRLAIEVTSAGAASTVARLGIYNATTSWQADTLVLDAGTVAVDSTGVKTVTINQALAAGRYFLALLGDGSPTVRMVRGGQEFMGLAPALGTGPFPGDWRAVQAYGALPTPGPAATTGGNASSPFECFVFCRVSTP
jgi:hypothetical protein